MPSAACVYRMVLQQAQPAPQNNSLLQHSRTECNDPGHSQSFFWLIWRKVAPATSCDGPVQFARLHLTLLFSGAWQQQVKTVVFPGDG